jgi:hypothetical protein
MATVTPTYSWPVPTSTDYVKDGATAIEALGDAVDATLTTALGGAYPGLRLIKKQTIGSAVASVSVTNAYSADYEAYKIIITGGVASATCDLGIINTGSTASYAYGYIVVNYSTGAITAVNSASAASMPHIGSGATGTLRANFDVLNPFLAKPTSFNANIASLNNAGSANGIHTLSTSYTGFTITPSTGTLTGGTIYVYGYGAS